ncbi:MAG: TonB-dependent receptor [Bacteroidota bacterium]
MKQLYCISICLLFPLIGIMGQLSAQESEIMIRKNYNQWDFGEFVQEVERENKLKFFYLDNWVDSLQVIQRSSPQRLEEILSASLASRKLSFVIDEGNRIILSLSPIKKELKTENVRAVRMRAPEGSRDLIAYSQLLAVKPDLSSEEIVRVIDIGSSDASKEEATIVGYVKDDETGEPIIGATVFVSELKVGVNTDQYGYYSLTLPTGNHMLTYRSYGKDEKEQEVNLFEDGKLDMEMEDAIRQLDVVLIEAERDENVESSQMGLTTLGINALKQMPTFMGEIDVIKSAILLPGVQTVGEGASGFNVRGGSTGQNLILINQAPIFNSSHLFGFFSVFNPDIIKNFDLYKSGIPARYGGRIASVLDISMKDGNKKEFVASGGVSPVTSRLTVEGPLKAQNSSFIIGARSTYSNWILRELEQLSFRNSKAFFGDLNAKVNLELSRKDRLDISGYFSQDNFTLNQDTAYSYNNLNGSINWKHLFNNKLFAVTSGIFSRYRFNVRSESSLENSFRLNYQILYNELKTDFTYIPEPNHQFRMGANAIFYQLNPGTQRPLNPESLIRSQTLEQEQAVESSIYISDEWDVNPRLKLYGGIRLSGYALLGPNSVNLYRPDQPLQPENIIDSTQYGSGSLVKFYGGPEIRLSARYALDEKSSVKLSFNRLRQYLHMLSNTTSISPTDTWKLSDPYIRPQVGDQLSLGFYRNFRQNSIESSVELYVKNISDMIEFKNGAQLLLNPEIETDVINARGRAYGVEFLIRKDRGKLNGWISYTYSRVFSEINGQFPDEIINGGERFPSNFDKPHDISFVGNYKFSRRLSISSNFAYSTGRPITYPISQFRFGNTNRLNYSLRNQFRIPDYYRWDFSINIEGNHRNTKFAHTSWSLSFFNILGRQNVYSIYFVSTPSGVQGYKLSIFGRPITTLTFNFKIL